MDDTQSFAGTPLLDDTVTDAGRGFPSPAAVATPAGKGDRSASAYSFQDLTDDALLSNAPRIEYLGAQRPALGGIPLLAKIGQGGMGAVYYGLHPQLGVGVAVKVLPLHLASRNPEMVQRFIREARIAGRINSVNLIYVRDVGQDSGYFYQIMEYVRGVSAGLCLKRLQASGQVGLSEVHALRICIAAARGLAAAHACGIIHRDVKPDNILVPVALEERKLLFSEAKVADLGLARTEHGEPPADDAAPRNQGRRKDESLTVVGKTLGTWGFMAPEQAHDAKNAGKPADVFSLGATLYALLAGQPPFRGVAVAERVLNTVLDRKDPITKLRPDVCEPTAVVIGCCLQKNPAKRFPDGATLLMALEDCLATAAGQRPPDDVAVKSMSLLAQETVDYTTTAFPAAPSAGPMVAAHAAGGVESTASPSTPAVPAIAALARASKPAQLIGAAGVVLFLLGTFVFLRGGDSRVATGLRAGNRTAAVAAPAPPEARAAQPETASPTPETPADLQKRADFDIALYQAHEHRAAKRFAEAKAAYERAKTVWPDAPNAGEADQGIAAVAADVRRQRREDLIGEGRFLLAAGKWADAEAAFKQVLRDNPNDEAATKCIVDVQYERTMAEGRDKLKAGDLAASEAAFQRALDLPGYAHVEAARAALEQARVLRTRAALPAQPAPAAPATPATAAVVPGSLAKLTTNELEGGQEYTNYLGRGRTCKIIFSKPTSKDSLTGVFHLGIGPYGPGEIVTTTLFPGGNTTCLISISLNGQEIFAGHDKASNAVYLKWGEQRYPFPAGILRPGRNELRVANMEPDGNLYQYPYYNIGSIEIIGALLPAFPPVVSQAQRNVIQTYDRVFELLAPKDLDVASRIEQSLRLAKSVSAPELQGLVGVLEKAQTLHSQALANLATNPPAEPVQIEKLKLTGTVIRIKDDKAFIKAQGIEMPVDVGLLPLSVFLKAAAFDETRPAGLADKAAYFFALGNIETAQQLLRRLKKGEAPAWESLFAQRAAFDRLLKFEASVAAIEVALKNSNTAEALGLLNAVKQDCPDLVAANKERFVYLTTAAEGSKVR
ncbi:MAG: protein kinase [Planctomycetota bacterium]|nr:protein kinase [Planctomycetota bacterium]